MRRAATWVARVLGVAKGPQADGKGQCHLPCCLSSACAGSTSRGDRCSRRRASCRGSTVRRGAAAEAPPHPPFERVARWGAAHLRLLGCAARGSGLAAGGAGAVIASWQLQVLEGELLLRLIPWAGGPCACRGREHRSNSVLLTIDLSTGEAFQQCFDRQCVVPRNGGCVVASAFVGVAPSGSVPPRGVLREFASLAR